VWGGARAGHGVARGVEGGARGAKGVKRIAGWCKVDRASRKPLRCNIEVVTFGFYVTESRRI